MDDIAIATSSSSMKRNIRILERVFLQLFEMATVNSIQFDPLKPELMHFTNCKSAKDYPLTLPNGLKVDHSQKI